MSKRQSDVLHNNFCGDSYICSVQQTRIYDSSTALRKLSCTVHIIVQDESTSWELNLAEISAEKLY